MRPGMENRIRLLLLSLALGGGLIALVPAARAYHDQGNPCYVCHSLKPADIRAGSNAIRWDQPVLSPVRTLSGSQAWTGGWPITCDFCHKSASDVPTKNFAGKANHHPVRTIMDNGAVPNEIACGDCHNGDIDGNGTKDLSPAGMTTKTATDGYPDHDNMSIGSYDNHLLSLNPPHLTAPYWSASSLPGVNRANDTAFWTAVRTTQDIVCWVCHQSGRTAPMTGATSTMAVRQDYVGTGRAKGHQIQTDTGGSQLGVGAAMPCYNCHDSHGSVNRALILDDNSIYGSATSQVVVTTFTGSSDLVVCAQCHDTGNAATSTGKSQPAQAGKSVEGIYPVDPYNSATFSTLHIDGEIADNMLASPRGACLANNGGCHASPHNPLGESIGGDRCGLCHGSLYAGMAAWKSSGYHHVMLGDNAPVAGVYPTNSQPQGAAADRTCTICHVDHNYFSPQATPGLQRAKNLRRDIATPPDNGTNAPVSSDFDNALSAGGICTSCHTRTQTKRNPGTDIKQDGSTTTPVVNKSFFGGSAHNYPAASPFIESRFKSDNTLFQSNCVKCHNDTSAKKFQDNTAPYSRRQFSLHASDGASAVNKLLAPLGYSPVTDNLGENFCYRCHSRLGDLAGGKASGARDWYDGVGMDNAAESTYGIFQRTSRHPVSTADQVAGSKAVNCLNCHNVHLTRSASGGIVSDPDNTYSLATYNVNDNSSVTSIQSRAVFCMKCHDGTVPVYQVDNSIYVPATVYAVNPTANKWTWGRVPDNAANSRGHWNVSGQLLGGASPTVKACDACHDKHGSTARKLLGVFDPADGVNRINGVAVSATVTAADNAAVCYSCHTAKGKSYADNVTVAAYEAFRDGTGYFSPPPSGTVTTVRWPGKVAYDCTAEVFGSKQSPHGNTSADGPASLGSRKVADCNGCHDPHGTAYTYNMLTDNMSATTFKLCFDCHGLSGSPSPDNVARYYPTGNAGLSGASTSTTNVGHNIKTSGGYLAVGNGLPCYDCHMTHGSTRGNSQLKSDQRWTGLGNTKYGSTPSDNTADNNARIFCLGCHVTTDNRDGYGNTVQATDNVENLSRLGANRLKLPTVNAIVEHTSAWVGNGCQRCHGGRNYNDNTYGPHWPATGLCNTCHQGQGARSAGAATFTGSHQKHADNNASTAYGFACKQCHTWTGTLSRATHKNDDNATMFAEVAFDNQATAGWLTIQYATAFQYEYRSMYASPYGAPSPSPSYSGGTDNGTDNVQTSLHWRNGGCNNVWCHSNANPLLDVTPARRIGVSNAYDNVKWNSSLGTACATCHGGDATSGSPIGDNTAAKDGSVPHLRHVNGNIGCTKCHYNTVKTGNNRVVDNLASHVNGLKDVQFSPEVGGSWTGGACVATYCHGGGNPRWDNIATAVGCGVCHSSQTIMSPTDNNGAHKTHADNTMYRFSCEVCHANFATSGGGRQNAAHATGDNSAGPRTVEVYFTDNLSVQTYYGQTYWSDNLWRNPHTSLGVTPTYTENAAFVGGDNDAINPAISWSRGTCGTVWCHSNANPLTATGGVRQNKYRSPQWTGTLSCTPCHSGADNTANMGLDNGNLSAGHIRHAATNLYGFTCDECHARTVLNDTNNTINGSSGYDNHVNGVKSVFFSTTLRTTGVNQSGGTYDNVTNKNCSSTYCHSSGVDNDATGGFQGSVPSPRWDNVNVAGCTYCHGGSRSSPAPMATLSHPKHVGSNMMCYKCHYATAGLTGDNVLVAGAYGTNGTHVNGIRNVLFPPEIGGSYDPSTKTCSATYCHGTPGVLPKWDNQATVAGCGVCHSSQTINSPTDNNGVHKTHADNTTYRFSCEVCHANKAAGHTNAAHATGDNSAGPRTAEVYFTDNASTQRYSTNPTNYISDNLWRNPHTSLGVTPTYTENAAFVGGDNDAINPAISWSRGTCGSVWCHSNANPYPGTAGYNAYRSPQWTGTLSCTPCHGGSTTYAANLADNTQLSHGHAVHMATDNANGYGFACNECHAWTVQADNVTLIPGTGFDNHVNGSKTVRFNAAYKGSINQSGATFDNGAAHNCSATYCHSSGIDNDVAGGGFTGTVASPRWDNVQIPGCTYCHGYTAGSGSPIVSNAHDNHVNNAAVLGTNYTCNRCHDATVTAVDNAIKSRALHVNGYRNVVFSDNAATATWSSPTCINTFCHRQGNKTLTGGADNLSIAWDCTAVNTDCKTCHGSRTGAGYNTWPSLYGEPNYDNGTLGTSSQNSHGKHMRLPGANSTTFCYKCHANTADNTTAGKLMGTGSAHLNDNVDVAAGTGATFTWTSGTHTCSSISCHGGSPAVWGASLNCSSCHTSMGAGPGAAGYTATHRTHVDNTTYKYACEQCHAAKSGQGNVTHGSGDDNTSSGRYVEVKFTDNGILGGWTYGGASWVYDTANTFLARYGVSPNPTPSYLDNVGVAGTDPLASGISWSAGTCSSVWCHSNANPLTATGGVRQNKYRGPVWAGAQPCSYCHSWKDNTTNMGSDNGNLSAAHIQHAATNLYGFNCYECHAYTVSSTDNVVGYDNHVNAVKNVKFGTALRGTTLDQSGGTYDNVTNRNCSTTYCHGSGFDNTSGYATYSVTSPRWDNVNVAGCTYCHGGSSSTGSPIVSLAHDNHVGNTTSNVDYECRRCHTATVNGADNVTITNYANHVNARKDVAFLDNASWATYTTAGKNCSNTFCHRQGNRSIPSGADNLSIAWDCTVNTDCKTCHGSKGVQSNYTYASKAGEPNYDNGFNTSVANTQNSHYRHMQLPGADNTTFCYKCHGSTADNATAGKLRGAGHLNDNVEVVAGVSSGVSFGWTPGTHTCSNISCHGGTGNSAVWGAALGCQNCHSGTGDVDDFGTAGDPSTFRNARVAQIDNIEWTTRGHGATSNYAASNFPGAGFTGTNQCLYCHNGSVSHDNTSNIFRLANYNVYGNGWNDVCLVCHRKTGGHAGYNGGNATAAFVDNSHYGAKHTSTYNGGKFCYDCHDPHGDNNIFMVGRRVTMRTDDTYGIPYGTVVADNAYRPQVNFQGNTTGANYADNTTRQGICQVCHTTGVVNHWTSSAPWSDGHNAANKCTTCHLHDAAFKGLGGPDIGQYFDRLAFANYPDNSSHPLRGLTTGDNTLRFIGTGSENCLGCHYGSGSGKTSDECFMCHFENVGSGGTPGALDGTRHMDRQMQLATVSGNLLPTSAYTISTIQNYDSWCLQCHGSETGITLGGVPPQLLRRTVISAGGFANGRHRAVNALAGGPVGCIYCHQPHGRSNARIVRENPSNRASAGATPMRFGVYPSDNVGGYTGKYRAVANDNYLYRARTDNTLPNVFADADDDQSFCAKACHRYKDDPTYAKDKMIKRDGTTGNYVLAGTKKIFLVDGAEYTVDNIVSQGAPTFHGHVDGDIIPTDNMVKDYATLIGMTGPSYYQYPLTTSAHPTAYNSSISDLPFFPDYSPDGNRDFTNAWNVLGVRVKYRFTCSTCHNPHGTTLANTGGTASGYPDLRLPKTSPNTLCNRCHK